MIPFSGALPELAAAWDALEASAAAQNVTFGLNDFGGVRTAADTTLILQYRQSDFDAAVRAGTIPADTTLAHFRPIAPFGKSFHDVGAAVDVSPQSYPASLGYDGAVRALGALAGDAGLRWGGNFTNPDPAHFELAMSLAEAEQRWQNWQASGDVSDDLTALQLVSVEAQAPWLWLTVGVLAVFFLVRHRPVRRIA